MAGQAERPPLDIEFDNSAFIRALDARLRRAGRATEADMRATAVEITNNAKTFAAVKTGLMRNSIEWVEGHDAKGFFISIYCRVFYWKFVEFGTLRAVAQPFMRPGFAIGKRFLINRLNRRGAR